MDQELFNPQSPSVTSSRILYTPSTFARTSLLHLQEVGSLQAIHPHTSMRTNLTSFLCFVVLSGNGTLTYEGTAYELSAGDCVFIDCRKAYSHSTGYNADGNSTSVNNTSISTPTRVNETTCESYSGVRPHKEEINQISDDIRSQLKKISYKSSGVADTFDSLLCDYRYNAVSAVKQHWADDFTHIFLKSLNWKVLGVRPHKEKINISKECINKTR